MTRIPRRAAGALAVVLISLSAASCGGDDNEAADAYVSDVNRIQSQLVGAYQRLASEVTATSPAAEDAETFEELGKAMGVSVDRLRKVEVPEQVRRQHEQLTRSLETYSGDLAAAAEDLASGSSERTTEAERKLEQQTATLSESFAARVRDINARLSE